MARADPEKRASAAQLLVRYFNGAGLSTPAGSVALIELEDDNGPRHFPAIQASPPPVDVKGRHPTDPPRHHSETTFYYPMLSTPHWPCSRAHRPSYLGMRDSLILTRNRLG